MNIKFRLTTGTGEKNITVNAPDTISVSELRKDNSINESTPADKEAQFVYKGQVLNNNDTPQIIQYDSNEFISIVFVDIPKTKSDQRKKFLHVSQRLKYDPVSQRVKHDPKDIQTIDIPKGSTMKNIQQIVLDYYNSNIDVLENAPMKPRKSPDVPVRFFKCENLDQYSSSEIFNIDDFEKCSGTITFYFEGETFNTGGGSYHNRRRLSTTRKSSSSRRRFSKKRGTQRKQKRHQRRRSRRAY